MQPIEPAKTSADRTPPKLEFRRLAGRVKRGVFACGEREIDKWLVKSHNDHDQLKSRVTTAHLTGNPHPAAFYSLCIVVESDQDIEGHNGKLRIERAGAFAAVHLRYVATHKALQGRGIGASVMMEAITDFANVAKLTGICAMTLVAINEERAVWYEKLGFRRYGEPCARPKLLLPARSAIELVDS